MENTRRVISGAVVASILAMSSGCGADDQADVSTEKESTETTVTSKSDYAVAGYYDPGPATYRSLDDLRSQAAVIGVFRVAGQREGRRTLDLPDERSVQRILQLVVEDPIKGVEQGDTVEVWDATWTFARTDGDDWERRALTVTTEDRELRPGDRIVMALNRDPSGEGLYAVQSVSSFFLISANDAERFEPVERSNPVATAAQGRAVREVVDDLRA